MRIDPLVEWQRLSETYGRMYDAELLELAAAPEELTDQARHVLDDEIRKRGLKALGSDRIAGSFSNSLAERSDSTSGAPSDGPEGEDEEALVEYTWKTPLCGCETLDEAELLSEALTRAGIENWIARPGARQAILWDERMVGNLRILVAADQLDEAREISSKPIPKEIVEESQIEVPEFDLPVCPKCRADDPLLEGVDPVNRWRCDACGSEWSETGEADGNVSKTGKLQP